MNENVTQPTSTEVIKIAEKTAQSGNKTAWIIGGSVAAIAVAATGIILVIKHKKSKKQSVTKVEAEDK